MQIACTVLPSCRARLATVVCGFRWDCVCSAEERNNQKTPGEYVLNTSITHFNYAPTFLVCCCFFFSAVGLWRRHVEYLTRSFCGK